MTRIRGGAKNLIHVADIQVAVLAKQVSAAVAEGEARTGSKADLECASASGGKADIR